ncbi:MAG TPA: hypothetical protein VK642_13160 [Burkholderiales bacterium]|nr:hypothetical protein [Burkholderiales bacterium]
MLTPAMEVVVMGIKKGKGEFEGRPYDFTRIFVEESFKSDDESSRGFATVPYVIGKSTEFEKFKDHIYPVRAQLVLEINTTGKEQRTTVSSLKILSPVAKKAPA